jgi:hypothetical protein
LKEACKVVPKSLNSLKNFSLIYATWAWSQIISYIAPTFITQNQLLDFTRRFTIAFSNTPGMIKQLEYNGKLTHKNFGYITASGNIGISLICISYVDYFIFTCTADTGVMDDPKKLIGLIEGNLKKMMPSKDWKMPESSPEGKGKSAGKTS